MGLSILRGWTLFLFVVILVGNVTFTRNWFAISPYILYDPPPPKKKKPKKKQKKKKKTKKKQKKKKKKKAFY